MTRKTTFFEGLSLFKFNNLRLALGTNLKFYASVAKGLKLKVRKFWGLIPTFAKVTEERLVRSAFLSSPPSSIGLRQSLMRESLLQTITERKSLKFYKSIDILSVTNAIGQTEVTMIFLVVTFYVGWY